MFNRKLQVKDLEQYQRMQVAKDIQHIDREFFLSRLEEKEAAARLNGQPINENLLAFAKKKLIA